MPKSVLGRINDELIRTGAADIEQHTTGGVIAMNVSNDTVRLVDEGAEWVGLKAEALSRLATLADDAGFEAFWELFPE